jgi:CRISPR/Cas system CSM-associated protein Csm3 (group 7 of RAMP superfamily)
VTLRFDLKIQGPFLTNDTTAAVHSGFDSVPLLDVVSTNGNPILPGASLRGVLRSHAERIARTLATLEAANLGDFLAKCPACNPVESGDENAALANCDTLLRKVAKIPDEDEVTEDKLCLACRLFGSTRRGSRLIVEDAEADANTLRKVLDFLAIDRFTGGGKEGAKFDAVALWQPAFSVPLHLENPASWELGWLMLVLRDMQDEMLTVGFGGVKGFGRARLESLTMHYGFISDDDFAGPTDFASACTSPSSGLYRVITWDTRDNAQRERLGTLAQSWVDEFNKTWKELKRPPDLHLKKDTYFDGVVPKLYEKEAYQCLLKP